MFDVRYRELSGGAFLASDYVSHDWEGSTSGYACMNESCLAHPKSLGDHDLKEEFADMFMNYVLAGRSIRGVRYGFSLDLVGSSRLAWMQGGPAYTKLRPRQLPWADGVCEVTRVRLPI